MSTVSQVTPNQPAATSPTTREQTQAQVQNHRGFVVFFEKTGW